MEGVGGAWLGIEIEKGSLYGLARHARRREQEPRDTSGLGAREHPVASASTIIFYHATRPAADVLRSHEPQTKTIGGRPNSAMFPGSSTGSPCITTGEREAIFRMGFALRCFQRLSIAAWLPGAALSDNRCTSALILKSLPS